MLRSINGCCLITYSLQELWSIFTNFWQFRCPVFSRWRTSGWRRTAGIQATSLRSGFADAHLEATTSCRRPTQKWSEPGCGKSPGSCGTRPSGTEVSFQITCVQCGTIKPSRTGVSFSVTIKPSRTGVSFSVTIKPWRTGVSFSVTINPSGTEVSFSVTATLPAIFLCSVALLSHHKGELSVTLLPAILVQMAPVNHQKVRWPFCCSSSPQLFLYMTFELW